MCQGSVPPKQPLTEEVRRAEQRRLRTNLREKGHAVTSRRLAIYDVLLQTNDHICVEHILDAIQKAHPTWRMNKTTVYRTLDLLQELGFIYEMRHPDGRAQYELALRGPHGHLFCCACGKVQDIDTHVATAFQQELRAKQGFEIDLINNALMGLCANCALRAQD